MVNGIRTSYHHGLDKGFSLTFCVGSQVQHDTPEEGLRTYWPKCGEFNYEDNSLDILSDKNYHTNNTKSVWEIILVMCVRTENGSIWDSQKVSMTRILTPEWTQN